MSDFDRRFLAPNGGARDHYDVKQHVQDRGRAAERGSVAWFIGTLRDGPYAHGGYPKYWLLGDGTILSYKGALAECKQICQGLQEQRRNDREWQGVRCDVNWEDPDLQCDETGERIESAYAEDQASGSELECDSDNDGLPEQCSFCERDDE